MKTREAGRAASWRRSCWARLQTKLDMASAWLPLAEQSDKNSATDIVYATPVIHPTAAPPDTPAL